MRPFFGTGHPAFVWVDRMVFTVLAAKNYFSALMALREGAPG